MTIETRISDDNFLDLYAPVCFEMNDFWSQVWEEDKEFLQKCKEIQDDILHWRADDREVLKKILTDTLISIIWKSFFNPNWEFLVHNFIKTKIFTLRNNSDYILAGIKERIHFLDRLWGKMKDKNAANVSDSDISDIKNILAANISWSINTELRNFLNDLAQQKDNIFLSRLRIFLQKYQTKFYPDEVRATTRDILTK